MIEAVCCEQKKYISEIDEMMVFCGSHGIKYAGSPFKFCPYCGTLLKNIPYNWINWITNSSADTNEIFKESD